MIRTSILALALAACAANASAGDTLRVLFIGNSYTYVNDLPKMVSDMATSTGDKLIYSMSAPGGQTFQQHTTNSTTLSLIAQGNWDFVVLQEQSQRPSFDDAQVAFEVYPYAKKLDSLVKLQNSCAKTMYYMTWGRKTGDQDNCPFWPPVCTYEGMDSLLQLRYSNMASDNKGVLTPVAKVWRSLRTSNPNMELYDADKSHPSVKGTYAAAAAFYSVLFKRDPMQIGFNSSLSAADAGIIKTTVKQVVFDQLGTWYQHSPYVESGFNHTITGNDIALTSTSQHATNYLWLLGDGSTATGANAQHTYAQGGTYEVKLVASKCNDRDTMAKTITIGTGTGLQEVNQSMAGVYPNPVKGKVTITAKANITAVSVLDMTGRVVYAAQAASVLSTEADLSQLAPGMYFLRVQMGAAVAVIKLTHL
jgi:hypothetical protein